MKNKKIIDHNVPNTGKILMENTRTGSIVVKWNNGEVENISLLRLVSRWKVDKRSNRYEIIG